MRDFEFWSMWKKTVIMGFPHKKEPFPIANIGKKPNIKEVERRLVLLGYQPNYFSWGHRRQVTSMRRIYDVDENGIWRQYHIRVYKNGDVWGHEEICYDRNAIKHLTHTIHTKETYNKIPEEEINRILEKLLEE